MTQRDNGGSAFPSKFSLGTDGYGNEVFGVEQDMSMRDWFAGMIASGMAAHSGTSGVSYGPHDIAGRSYQVADALLAARIAP